MDSSKLKFPGVYITEAAFGGEAIAEVASALPAFIGYTEKAGGNDSESLELTPTLIDSFADYERLFGGAPVAPASAIKVTASEEGKSDDVNVIAGDEYRISVYNMYYSLRHYFDNGGGQCYIISVGNYLSAVTANDLLEGIAALAKQSTVTLLSVPECANTIEKLAGYNMVVNKMIQAAAALPNCFAIIDPYSVTPASAAQPDGAIATDIATMRDTIGTCTELQYAAAYYPTLITTYFHKVDKPNIVVHLATGVSKQLSAIDRNTSLYDQVMIKTGRLAVTLPPSAAIAGAYCYNDQSRGVWTAPANISLRSVMGLPVRITDREQEGMNLDTGSGKAVNAIRHFPGRGIMIWGARTLDGNSSDWRYVPVRRFVSMVEESIRSSCAWVSFEPNTQPTWDRLRATTEGYLNAKWRQGALAGAKAEEAFYVQTGREVITEEDILDGKLLLLVGMAITRPAEFIITQIEFRTLQA